MAMPKEMRGKIQETHIVERYLAYINERPNIPTWGVERRREWIESLQEQLKADNLSWVQKLKIQQKIRTHEEAINGADVEDPTDDFVEVCWSFSERHHIDYQTWRELGVPARVLKEAGW